MKKIAVYAGTFDPPTLGHLWVIEQASLFFDEVIVALGINPEKKTTFSVEDRLEMLKHAVIPFQNVRVEQFENEYLVYYAASIKANFIIRGIRNNQDFEYERALRHINSQLEPSIMTLFLMPPKDIAEVSSSLVKGLIGPHGWETVVGSLVPIATFAKILNSKHTVWGNLLAYGAVGDAQNFWYDLIESYTQEQRSYHTLDHISSMLRDFNKVKHLLKDPLAVELAIWFHDFHYETKSSYPKNEEVSAILAGKTIQYLQLPDRFNKKVQNLILATKHRFIPEDNDSQYLVDIDLGIFGQPDSIFDNYEKAIRKEYAHVPENIYATERTKILKQFLDRPTIYATKYFRSDYEDIARKNIERSIKNLKG